MKLTAFVLATLCMALVACAEIKTQTVEYKDGDATLKGYLAFDDAVEGKRPGIVVVPEWWGLNDYPKSRAEQLAKLGYVAFVADIYGDGYTTADPKVAGQKSGEVKKADLLAKRGGLALEQLRKDPHVDPAKTAAIGYCFGGATVLEMARRGQELLGVVSFHGALDTEHPAQDGAVKAKILVCHGDADPFVPAEQLQKFEQEMKKANVNVKVIHYADAKHAFTNPNVDKYGLDGAAYNKAADEKSWQDMQAFFGELFGNAPKPQAKAAAPGEYYIDGHILRTGVYSLSGRKITLRQAIAAAGGVDPPDLHDVKLTLIRRSGKEQEEIIERTFENAGKDGTLDLAMAPNDVLRINGK